MIRHQSRAEHDPLKIYRSSPGSLLVAFAFYISVAPVVWVVLAAKDLAAVPASNPLTHVAPRSERRSFCGGFQKTEETVPEVDHDC